MAEEPNPAPGRQSHKHAPNAFTLLELMVALAIVAILVVLSIFGLRDVKARVELAACAQNLRSLYGATSVYVTENGHWPLISTELGTGKFESAWVNTLKPYGISIDTWRCVTVGRSLEELGYSESDAPVIHYSPSEFDPHPLTPYKWAHHPWFIEITDVHGGGNLMIQSNGAVIPFDEAARAGGGVAF